MNMSHSIVYNPQGIILIKFQGPLILAEVRHVVIEVGRPAHDSQCFRLLTDTLEMELKLSMMDYVGVQSSPRPGFHRCMNWQSNLTNGYSSGIREESILEICDPINSNLANRNRVYEIVGIGW
jgi:hypothetical protein